MRTLRLVAFAAALLLSLAAAAQDIAQWPHTLEAVMTLEMRKPHLHSLSLIS